MRRSRRVCPARTLRAFALVIASVALSGCKGGRAAEPAPTTASARVRRTFEQGLDSLGASLDRLGTVVSRKTASADDDRQRARDAFIDARIAYKRIETLLEPYGPEVIEQLNGPREISEEHAYLPLGQPAGFQIVEDALYGDGRGLRADSLPATVHAMRRAVTALRAQTARLTLTDAEVADALRLEVARVSTLGVAGFDAPRSGQAILESAAALDGARTFVRDVAVNEALALASSYLREHAQFDSLDRLQFIVAYANPLARAVADARRAFPAPPPLRRLWRQTASSVFEADALDASALAPLDAAAFSPELVALGRRLFFEPALSGPGTRSCASCHDPARAFTDGRARSALIAAPRGTHRNTPTLLGAAYELALFDDLRAGSLEMQAGMVLANPAEMASSAELAATRLRADSSYRAAFARVLPGRSDGAITERSVRAALAAYVRSLSAGTLDTRFDRAARGDASALSAEERLGFTTFMGKGRCGTCHFAPLFGGTRPPDFVESEAEIIGVPDRVRAKGARVDPDAGLGGSDAQTTHFGAFKVPSLRNVALTAPYMHNGVFRTLDDVVDFYDHGGGAGAGLHVPYQTLPSDSLHLSPREKRALVAFLRSLTSERATVRTVR